MIAPSWASGLFLYHGHIVSKLFAHGKLHSKKETPASTGTGTGVLAGAVWRLKVHRGP